jgi:hypothetical protein
VILSTETRLSVIVRSAGLNFLQYLSRIQFRGSIYYTLSRVLVDGVTYAFEWVKELRETWTQTGEKEFHSFKLISIHLVRLETFLEFLFDPGEFQDSNNDIKTFGLLFRFDFSELSLI